MTASNGFRHCRKFISSMLKLSIREIWWTLDLQTLACMLQVKIKFGLKFFNLG